jgi:hypothetical protein
MIEGAVFRSLRVRSKPDKYVPDLGSLSADWLARSPDIPITLRQINELPDSAKRRTYRALLPPALLTRMGVNPITWKSVDGDQCVVLKANPGSGLVSLSVHSSNQAREEQFQIELQDTSLNGINLNFLLIQDADSPRFLTDRDVDGKPTLFGTLRRNIDAEEEAMKAGLSPGQVRKGLRLSAVALQHLEAFLVTIGHSAYFLEPLTYTSAWLFERRGFAYVRGHKLMDEIDHEFRPGGRLHQSLDGSTVFRQPEMWRTVRGRAWAIHDGILKVIGGQWDGLRMIKQVGRSAGVNTFEDAVY